jgi:hypothetical protein
MEIYVHQFMNDDEQIWHDHPWTFISLTLAGEYYDDYPPPLQRRKIRRGQMIFRGMRYKHRNILDETYKGRTFTLVITGRRKRQWSYYSSHQNKLSTSDYAKLRGMEVTVFSKGLLTGSVFPKWEFADYIPGHLSAERRS